MVDSISVIECVQLRQPGRTVVICATRQIVVGQPLCFFTFKMRDIPCKLGGMSVEFNFLSSIFSFLCQLWLVSPPSDLVIF